MSSLQKDVNFFLAGLYLKQPVFQSSCNCTQGFFGHRIANFYSYFFQFHDFLRASQAYKFFYFLLIASPLRL